MCDDEQVRMPEGSEFQTEGGTTLKQQRLCIPGAVKVVLFMMAIVLQKSDWFLLDVKWLPAHMIEQSCIMQATVEL